MSAFYEPWASLLGLAAGVRLLTEKEVWSLIATLQVGKWEAQAACNMFRVIYPGVCASKGSYAG